MPRAYAAFRNDRAFGNRRPAGCREGQPPPSSRWRPRDLWLSAFTTVPLCLGLWLVLLLAETGGALAQDAPISGDARERGEAILEELDQTQSDSASQTRVRQLITTSGGQEREFQMEMFSSSGQGELLVVYREPARVRGVSFLMLNDRDDTWTYSPKTRRTRKLNSSSSKRSVNGSNFSYEDFGAGMGQLGEDYHARHLGEELLAEVLCDRVELTPEADDATYSRLVAWISRDPRVIRRVDYFDADDKPLKRLTASEVRDAGKVPTAHRYRMENLQGSDATEMEIIELRREAQLPENTFTLENLARQ